MGVQPGSKQPPKKYKTSDLKSKILRPSLTSTYAVYFNAAYIQEKGKKFFTDRQSIIDGEFLTVSCSEASLPGSSLATNEINNDYTGVTERHAYRRIYDDRSDFTFYVDGDYKILKFFETWISFIVNENQFSDQAKGSYNYRMKFPNDYRVPIHIQKFEKDYSKYVEYTFIDAYPIAINSMPVSYDSSQPLKCTVSFAYTRYFLGNPVFNTNSEDEPQTPDLTQNRQFFNNQTLEEQQRLRDRYNIQ